MNVLWALLALFSPVIAAAAVKQLVFRRIRSATGRILATAAGSIVITTAILAVLFLRGRWAGPDGQFPEDVGGWLQDAIIHGTYFGLIAAFVNLLRWDSNLPDDTPRS